MCVCILHIWLCEIDYLFCTCSCPVPYAIQPHALTRWSHLFFLFLIPNFINGCLLHEQLKVSASLDLHCISWIEKQWIFMIFPNSCFYCPSKVFGGSLCHHCSLLWNALSSFSCLLLCSLWKEDIGLHNPLSQPSSKRGGNINHQLKRRKMYIIYTKVWW